LTVSAGAAVVDVTQRDLHCVSMPAASGALTMQRPLTPLAMAVWQSWQTERHWFTSMSPPLRNDSASIQPRAAVYKPFAAHTLCGAGVGWTAPVALGAAVAVVDSFVDAFVLFPAGVSKASVVG